MSVEMETVSWGSSQPMGYDAPATLADYYTESLGEEQKKGMGTFWTWAPLIGLAWGYYFLSAATED
jgi:hypothetical protein